MPEPGKTISPTGSVLQKLIVALEGRGLGVARPVGLEGDLRDLAAVGPAGCDALGALRCAAVQKHHVGVFGVHPVKDGPNAQVIGAILPAGKSDPRAGRQMDLGVGAPLCGDKVATVDDGGGQVAVIDARPGARCPRRSGQLPEVFGGTVGKRLEAVAALEEGEPDRQQLLELHRGDLGAVLLA